jgi:hypothetical protein
MMVEGQKAEPGINEAAVRKGCNSRYRWKGPGEFFVRQVLAQEAYFLPPLPPLEPEPFEPLSLSDPDFEPPEGFCAILLSYEFATKGERAYRAHVQLGGANIVEESLLQCSSGEGLSAAKLPRVPFWPCDAVLEGAEQMVLLP